jgi:hypothetical protein
LWPTRVNRALLPAACTLLLGTGAAVQLALPLPGDMPEDGAPSRAPQWHLPDTAVLPAPNLAERPSLFSPTRLVGDAGAPGDAAAAPPPEGPVGGAFVLGAMRSGGRQVLLLRTPGKAVVRMLPGGAWHGWRLLAIDEDAARFRKDGKTMTLAFGASAPAAQDGDSSESEE